MNHDEFITYLKNNINDELIIEVRTIIRNHIREKKIKSGAGKITKKSKRKTEYVSPDLVVRFD